MILGQIGSILGHKLALPEWLDIRLYYLRMSFLMHILRIERLK